MLPSPVRENCRGDMAAARLLDEWLAYCRTADGWLASLSTYHNRYRLIRSRAPELWGVLSLHVGAVDLLADRHVRMIELEMGRLRTFMYVVPRGAHARAYTQLS